MKKFFGYMVFIVGLSVGHTLCMFPGDDEMTVVQKLHSAMDSGNSSEIAMLMGMHEHQPWFKKLVNMQVGSESRTPLHVVAASGDVGAVKILLSVKGINVNATDAYGLTPLYLAAAERKDFSGFGKNTTIAGYVEVIKALLAAGANINIVNDGETKKAHGSSETLGELKTFIKGLKGLKPGETKTEEPAPTQELTQANFFMAIKDGKLAQLKKWFSEKKDECATFFDVEDDKSSGLKPLFVAARFSYSRPEITRLLLKNGAKTDVTASQKVHRGINCAVAKGDTPLSMLTTWLTENKEDFTPKKEEYVLEIIEMLKNPPAPSAPAKTAVATPVTADEMKDFWKACKDGNKDVVAGFLARGVDKDSVDQGFTPLLIAISYKHKDLVRYLLEQKADQNKAQSNGPQNTPLHLAVIINNVEIVHMLLEKKADPNAKNRADNTALFEAIDAVVNDPAVRNNDDALNSMLDIMRKLVKAGANPEDGGHNGTPLAKATEWKDGKIGEREIFKEILAILQPTALQPTPSDASTALFTALGQLKLQLGNLITALGTVGKAE